MRQFYVVQTQPMAEPLARANLINQRFEVFLPTFIIERGRTTKLEPLFPGYLFVRFDLGADPWRVIVSTRGVKRILGANCEEPTCVPARVMDELIRGYEAGLYVRTENIAGVQAGDIARVIGGAFAGHLGTCVEQRRSRVKLLMGLLGAAVEVCFPIELVERAA